MDLHINLSITCCVPAREALRGRELVRGMMDEVCCPGRGPRLHVRDISGAFQRPLKTGPQPLHLPVPSSTTAQPRYP